MHLSVTLAAQVDAVTWTVGVAVADVATTTMMPVHTLAAASFTQPMRTLLHDGARAGGDRLCFHFTIPKLAVTTLPASSKCGVHGNCPRAMSPTFTASGHALRLTLGFRVRTRS